MSCRPSTLHIHPPLTRLRYASFTRNHKGTTSDHVEIKPNQAAGISESGIILLSVNRPSPIVHATLDRSCILAHTRTRTPTPQTCCWVPLSLLPSTATINLHGYVHSALTVGRLTHTHTHILVATASLSLSPSTYTHDVLHAVDILSLLPPPSFLPGFLVPSIYLCTLSAELVH